MSIVKYSKKDGDIGITINGNPATARTLYISHRAAKELNTFVGQISEADFITILSELGKNIGVEPVNREPAKAPVSDNEALIKAETERDIYKNLYQELLKKL